MSSRLFVAELIDQFERHGNPALSRWQERHAIADRTCGATSLVRPCRANVEMTSPTLCVPARPGAWPRREHRRRSRVWFAWPDCGKNRDASHKRITHHASRITWPQASMAYQPRATLRWRLHRAALPWLHRFQAPPQPRRSCCRLEARERLPRGLRHWLARKTTCRSTVTAILPAASAVLAAAPAA